MRVKSFRYKSFILVSFSAGWTEDDKTFGDTFIIGVELSSVKLNEGCILPYDYLRKMLMQFDGANLNEVMEPMEPTKENLSRYISQIVLDYVFKLDVHETVSVDRVKVTSSKGEWSEVIYQYEEGS